MPKRPSGPHYLRFEMRGSSAGLFGVAEAVWDYARWRGATDGSVLGGLRPARFRRHEAEMLAQIRWLHDSTPLPPWDAFPVGEHQRRPRCWFTPEAKEHQTRSWRLCHMLNLCGVPLRPLWAASPGGEVLYRDAVQVVILPDRGLIRPHHDTRRRAAQGWTGSRRTIRYGTGLHWVNTRTNPLRRPGEAP